MSVIKKLRRKRKPWKKNNQLNAKNNGIRDQKKRNEHVSELISTLWKTLKGELT
jgi:hypothetical protein